MDGSVELVVVDVELVVVDVDGSVELVVVVVGGGVVGGSPVSVITTFTPLAFIVCTSILELLALELLTALILAVKPFGDVYVIIVPPFGPGSDRV